MIRLPETVSVLVPNIVKVAPLAIEILLQTAAAPAFIVGWFPPEGITTSDEEVGLIAPHQFDALFQSVLTEPDQVPTLQPFVVVTSPLEPARNQVSFWFDGGALIDEVLP